MKTRAFAVLTVALLCSVPGFAQWVACTNNANSETCTTRAVGIGTLTPLTSLVVHTGFGRNVEAGYTATTGLYLEGIDRTPGTVDFSLYNGGAGNLRFFTNAIERLRIGPSGNVGIGSLTPGFSASGSRYLTLSVDRATNTPTNQSVLEILGAQSNGGQPSGRVSFLQSWDNGVNLSENARIEHILQTDTSNGGQLAFYTKSNTSALTERMRIDQAGQVNIGGIPPGTDGTEKLLVNGTIRGTNVVATYQDLAEWVPASHDMLAGTVVVVDPDAENGVMPSSHSYDTAVAGVVSAQPGVLLGVAGASKEKIATTGRVKVHVDATKAAIRPGDLLVTSDKPGIAMKSEAIDLNGRKIHQPGTIIGKALQPLANGEGEILVLLSLQ